MEKVFTSKEIRAFLNNAVIAAKSQHGFVFDSLSKGRKQALRNYAGALIAPLQSDVDKEYLTEQEATYLLTVAAVFISRRYLSIKMPADDEAEMLFGQNEFMQVLPHMLCIDCGARTDNVLTKEVMGEITKTKKRGRPKRDN